MADSILQIEVLECPFVLDESGNRKWQCRMPHAFGIAQMPSAIRRLMHYKPRKGTCMIVYVLMLLFFVLPVTVVAYLRVKAGRYPLPYFCNNVVVSRVKLRKEVGVVSPIMFWCLHVALVVMALEIEAWLAALTLIAYMVASAMLWNEIKAKGVDVNPEIAGANSSQTPIPPSE